LAFCGLATTTLSATGFIADFCLEGAFLLNMRINVPEVGRDGKNLRHGGTDRSKAEIRADLKRIFHRTVDFIFMA
jgi:hypothetical protein